MSNNFKVGDVVQLNSGGSAMTVEEIEGNYVSCVWFEKQKVERATFPAATLSKFEPAAF